MMPTLEITNFEKKILIDEPFVSVEVRLKSFDSTYHAQKFDIV